MEGDWNLAFSVITACDELVRASRQKITGKRSRYIYIFSPQAYSCLCP